MSTFSFNPFDWYWKADDGRIYSSKSQKTVPENDAGYQLWTSQGALPTVWPRNDSGKQTDQAMSDVVTEYGLSVPGVIIVPASVTRAQAKIALHRAGLLDMVKTAVEADPELEIWFEDATVWERQNEHVIALGMKLLGDAKAIDDLFVTADKIDV